jgi:cytochrome c peroxidase
VPLSIRSTRFAGATKYLRDHPDFEHFDRLEFIAKHVQPLAHSLSVVHSTLAIGAPTKPRAWSAHSASIYDRDAFDPMFFAALGAPRPDSGITDLGRALFFDKRLSPSGTRSCASCHDLARAFTDGRPRAALMPGHAVRGGGRNTPTLINAALQPTLFDDGRAATLEDQATDVLGSPAEMGGSLDHATTVLSRDASLSARFARAFSLPRDSAVRPQTVRFALAAYVRSLVALNSRFDRAARGEASALSDEERRGFNLFMGKARCGTCHFAPLFNGAMPPFLTESEPEVIGVPARRTAHSPVDPDSGRFHLRRIELQLFAFKTPTLRNIALTAPYMHNGVFETLDQVVDFYDAGGGHGVGINIQQTLPTDSLRLSAVEKRAIVAFMRALTDTLITRR